MILKNKNILITGGTGSFGKKFIKKILKYKPNKIIIYSRDELKQYELQKKWPISNDNPFRYFIGDVRDSERLKIAMENVDYVVHAAAIKHVPLAEYNPFEAIKTNIIGAQNVIDASLYNNVKKIIALSTDKAAAPINLYGATKLASDKLFIAANNYRGNKKIKFSVVRYGNVMASRGSVIPYFLTLKSNDHFPITDKRMTRFNITLDEGVDFVMSCFDKMWGGEIFVPKIPSYKITDVVKAINTNAKIKIIGVRPGEKLHEIMITKDDSVNTLEFKKYFVILPSSDLWEVKKFINKDKKDKGKFMKYGFEYSSSDNSNFLNVSKIKKLINTLK